MSKRKLATWKDIRQKYESGAGSVAGICAEFKITPGALYYHRRIEGWQKRQGRGSGSCSGLKPRSVGSSSSKLKSVETESIDKPIGKVSAGGGCARRMGKALKSQSAVGLNEATVGARLFEVLEIKLAEIEARILSGEQPSAADNEREQRVIGNLIRNFDKLTEFNERRSKGADQGKQSGKRQLSKDDGGEELAKLNAMQFREEIARRIEHFEKAGKP